MKQHSSDRGGVPSTAAIAGHPIHPMLVPFPLAFLFSVVVTDLAQVATGDVFWARFSFWLLTAGLGTALLAAIFGLVDFMTLKAVRAYPAAWIHFIGNVTAVLLALVNWFGRLRDPAGAVGGWDIVLSAMVAVILTFTGWFGGELSYRHGVGMHRDSEPE